MSSISEVTVVVADPQPVVRNGLRALLGSGTGVRIAAEADTRRDAVRLASAHRPDVLILDLDLCGGTEAIAEVLQRAPGVAVLIFTTRDDDASVLAAMRAGASGYLLKSTGDEGILRAVRGLAAGEAVFGSVIARRLTGLLAVPPAPEEAFPGLTARERQVLDLVATGLRNAAIATRLQLSPKTVSNHLSVIFGKLRVDGRPGAIVLAREAGLGRR
ncbi:DNA-binding response regulator [Actinoplanes sp. NBRC 14428]|uniref:LuxR family two component transcriptional regulator n=1 Tax=Pseudosporangium ferrugineum TaxID=439699 RepID=A0A2T0SES1_9ACTN|nr:response regulator transcription factor [Pseudosporangium ferrugineum]PRY31843.1 LuxR family two component transcriptional regulator [Pseudosporangium ferrugineum]BCJ49926.1 DNA-binding response regulator [Actinoplanes sp. NBRC 14428]